VLWEMLAGQRLFYSHGMTDGEAVGRILTLPVRPPSSVNPNVSSRVDEIVLRALQRSPETRFASARELASELEAAIDIASPSLVAEWVERACPKRMARLTRILTSTRRRMARTQLGFTSTGALPEEKAMPAESSAEHIPTSVTVNEKPTRRVERPRGKIAIVVALLVLASGIAFLSRLIWATHTIATAPTPAPAVPALRAPEVSSISPPPKAIPVPAQPAQTANSVLEPTGGQVRRPATRPSARAGRPRHEGSKPRTRQVMTAKDSARPNCNPPTYLDSDGIRVFKEECL